MPFFRRKDVCMKRILAFFVVLTLLFTFFTVPSVSADKKIDDRILQFEDDFTENYSNWRLGGGVIKDGKLLLSGAGFKTAILNTKFSGTDHQLSFNNFTLEFDVTLFESEKMDFFKIDVAGYQLLFREGKFYYVSPGSRNENDGTEYLRETDVLYNFKITVTDDLLLGYVKRADENSYKNVLAIARTSSGGTGFTLCSYLNCEIDNVKVYAENKSKNIVDKKIRRIAVGEVDNIVLTNTTADSFKYTSMHPSIATVSEDGSVTGVSNGTALIQISDSSGNVIENAKVSVYEPIQSLNFLMTDSNRTFEVGDTFCVMCEAQPSGAQLFVNWSVDKPDVLEQYGQSNVSNTFTALQPGVAKIRIQDKQGVAFNEMEITVVPKKERLPNQDVLAFSLTGRTTEINDNFFGNSGNIHTFSENTADGTIKHEDLYVDAQFQGWRQLDLFPWKTKLGDKTFEQWVSENGTGLKKFLEFVNKYKDIQPIICMPGGAYTAEEFFRMTKYFIDNYTGNKPVILEFCNEVYAISWEETYSKAEDYFSTAAEFADLVHIEYPDIKVIVSLIGQPMETNILSDPNNMAQLEDDWAYSQPHRVKEWNSTYLKYKEHFDGYTIHTYSAHTLVGGVTASKNWSQLTGYAQQDYYGFLNSAERFGNDSKAYVTEYGQLCSEVFWGANFDDAAKIRHQRGKYPVAGMSYMEMLLYMAKSGKVELTNYHTCIDGQGFGVFSDSGDRQGIYHPFKKIGELFNNNNTMYDLQSTIQDYDVISRPYYWGGNENINQNAVEAWGLGDDTGVKEVVFSNRTTYPKKIKINGAKIKPTWSYGGSEDAIAPGWMKNENYTSVFQNVSLLPNADELIPLPNTYDGASFEEEIVLPPLSVTVVDVEGTPNVIEGHASEKLSKITEYRLSHALALKLNSPVAYNDNVRTQIDVNNSAIVPVTKGGRTLLPLRFVSESFGCEVTYDEATQGIVIKNKDTLINLTVGEKKYIVNGKDMEFDVPAEATEGRTLVPLRALAEALGKDVLWDSRGIIIITNDNTAFLDYDEATGVVDKDCIDESNAKIDEVISLFE